jgi:hypothetical protein
MAETCAFRQVARLMLDSRQRGTSLKGKGQTMSRIEFIAGSLLWVAAALLMPMAALEPVQATHAASTPAAAGQL